MDSDRPFDYSESRAVLIGTSEYQDERFPALPAADNSLEGMRQILTNPELCGWPASRVRQLSNVSDNRQLIIKLRQWARETTGVFLLYFVGHGTPGEKGPCLTLTDTHEELPAATGLEYSRVRKALLDSPARVKIVILDCCYAGRAVPPVQSGQTLFTDISGTFVLAAADHAAHVPENQELVCTSFTGELLDLLRKGITDGPEELTLEDIYRHLRARLGEVDLPEPNCGGTDTAGAFRFARNAAFRQGPPIPRFPQEPESAVPWWRRPRRVWGNVAMAVALLACAAAYAFSRPDGPNLSCEPAAGAPGLQGRPVVIGSQSTVYPENELIAYIYRDALLANGVQVEPGITGGDRTVYYPQVCQGVLTIVPEYNGALLTTQQVDPGSTAVTTTAVDNALDRDLPSSLEILEPAPAQDKDSLTVTAATAAHYHLKSITGLRRVASRLKLGALGEFNSREAGDAGLKSMYGVIFGNFIPLTRSGDAVKDLLNGRVDVADVFTTNPEIKARHLVVLTDPKSLFRAENVIPLVYKAALRANPKIETTLNYVSQRLTQSQLLTLNVKAVQKGANLAAIAKEWAQVNVPAPRVRADRQYARVDSR
jgi:glycine betaine/choline ABC-type transport system substrate-binding protein